jgi:hypothetical protein
MTTSHESGANGGRIEDRVAIQDALYRYARGVDRRNWELVRSSYHADAYDDHGMYKGGIDGFIDYLSGRHQTVDLSLHFLTNSFIEWTGQDAALVETYFISRKLQKPKGGEGNSAMRPDYEAEGKTVEGEILGRYIDHFTRREGEWRILERVVVYESMRSTLVPDVALASAYTPARRDGGDPLERKRRALGLAP